MLERISLPEWIKNHEAYKGCQIFLKVWDGRLEVTGVGPGDGWVITGSGLSQRSFMVGGDQLLEVERPQ